MHIVLIGPGRIGADLAERLRKDGHTVTILSRRDYGDVTDPALTDRAFNVVHAIPDCDAVLHLLGCFERNSGTGRLLAANVTAPVLFATLFYVHLPHAQQIFFLDARIDRDASTDPPEFTEYLASKRVLATAFRRFALDWGKENGTRVNAIAPGPVLPPPKPGHGEKAGRCLTQRPTLADIHACVNFLLAAPSVTGQILYPASGQQLL